MYNKTIIIEERKLVIEGAWTQLIRRRKRPKWTFNVRKISEIEEGRIVCLPPIEQEVLFFNHYKYIESEMSDERPNDDLPASEQAVPRPHRRVTGEDRGLHRSKAYKSKPKASINESRSRVTKRTIQYPRSGAAIRT